MASRVAVLTLIVVAVRIGLGELDVGLEQAHRALTVRTLSNLHEVVVDVNGEFVIVRWHNVSAVDVLVNRVDCLRFRGAALIDIWRFLVRCDFIRRYVNARL